MGSPFPTGRKTIHYFVTDDDTGEQGGCTVTCVDGICSLSYPHDVPTEIPDPGTTSVIEAALWASSMLHGNGRLRHPKKIIQFIPPAKRAG